MPPQVTETTNSAQTPVQPDEFQIAQKEAETANASRSGIGTRLKVGRTRGKGSIVIKYEAFDESQPDTLPKSIEQFQNVTGIKTEQELLDRLIAGHNEMLYTAASDPLAEFVEEVWPAEVKTQFRLVVRNYSRGASVSLDDAVELIKPGFVKQFGPSATS